MRRRLDLTKKGLRLSQANLKQICPGSIDLTKKGQPQLCKYERLLIMTDRREEKPEGALCGAVIVFTGRLEIPRREAIATAKAIGCRVASAVTKKTTLVVVGIQDKRKLAGHEKSAKLRKAEQLIEQGLPVRILSEAQFEELVLNANHSYRRQLFLF